jgi:hypothetical protein
LIYDATIISIDDNGETCTVRYNYYNNEEQQQLSDLLMPAGASDSCQQSSSMQSDVSEGVTSVINKCLSIMSNSVFLHDPFLILKHFNSGRCFTVLKIICDHISSNTLGGMHDKQGVPIQHLKLSRVINCLQKAANNFVTASINKIIHCTCGNCYVVETEALDHLQVRILTAFVMIFKIHMVRGVQSIVTMTQVVPCKSRCLVKVGGKKK